MMKQIIVLVAAFAMLGTAVLASRHKSLYDKLAERMTEIEGKTAALQSRVDELNARLDAAIKEGTKREK